MTDEEKKAFKVLENFRRELGLYANGIQINRGFAIETILNLIEKKSKEIEELKVQNNKLAQCHFRYEEMTGIDLLLPDKLEYTSNDKIKAKIEEIDKKLEYETNGWESEYEYCKQVLQSLLKEE